MPEPACLHRTVKVIEGVDLPTTTVACCSCPARVELDTARLADRSLKAGITWTPGLQYRFARWLLTHGDAPSLEAPRA